MQLYDALPVRPGCAIAIVRPVAFCGHRGAGFLRGVGNYGRYQPGFIHREHHWVVSKGSYSKASSRPAQPMYASRVAMGGVIAMVAQVVFSRGRDVDSLGGEVNYCRCQPDMRYQVYYWTARGYLILHASNFQSFGMHCGCNRFEWLSETTFQG